MIEVLPYHATPIGGLQSPTAYAHETSQLWLQAVVERDWHLAHAENWDRSIPGKLGGPVVSKFVNYRHHQDARQAEGKVQRRSPTFESDLASLREAFGSWTTHQQIVAHHALVDHKLPKHLLDQFEAEMNPQANPDTNLMSWFSHEPTEAEPYGASLEDLGLLVRWNGRVAERIASSKAYRAELNQSLTLFADSKEAAVTARKLDKSWLGKKPDVSQFIIGDMLDPLALGYGTDGTVEARTADYVKGFGHVRLWPYDYAHGIKAGDHQRTHEFVHSIGGFVTPWIREGYTEWYAAIIDNIDATDTDHTLYGNLTRSIDVLHNGATNPIDELKVSAVFLGPDELENEMQLRTIINTGYGRDVMGALDNLAADLPNCKTADGESISAVGIAYAMETACYLIARVNFNYTHNQPDLAREALEGFKSLANKYEYEAGKVILKAVTDLFEDKLTIGVTP